MNLHAQEKTIALPVIRSAGTSYQDSTKYDTDSVLSPEVTTPIRVQLIHPPQRTSATNLVSSVAIPPLGLAYLASSLQDAGHQVSVVDAIGEGLDHIFEWEGRALRGLDFDDIVQRIDLRANVIGVGMMFSCAWPSLRALLHAIKLRHPDALLVLGGEHPTAMTERVFQESPIDFVVLGEGEGTLVEMCHRLAQNLDLSDLVGVALRENGRVRINPRRERIRDIDTIPPPAWELFDIDRYIEFGQPHGSADGRSMPLLATRGCPFQCTFCGSPGMWGTTWRARTPKLVVDEIERYMACYGANDFHFEDLTAIVRKDWVLDFSEEIIRRKLKISWQLPSGTRSEAIDEEVSRAMYASGCRQFTYALESGSKEILKRIKKRIDLDRAFQSARGAIAAGIRVQGAFIYGFPGETKRQMWQTYRTIIKCAVVGFHEISVCALQPLPNTEMFREIDADQGIETDDAYLDSIYGYLSIWQQKSWNSHISDLGLRVLILFSFASFFSLSFLIRPKRAFTFLRGLFGSKSEGKLGRILKGLARNFRTSRLRQVPST